MATQFNLKTQEDGQKHVRIVFPDGRESQPYFSKRAFQNALQALLDSPPPGIEFHVTDILALSKQEQKINLPNNEGNRLSTVVIMGFSGGFFGGVSMMMFSTSEDYLIERKPETHVSIDRCYCGCGHWHVHYGDEHSDAFYSLEGGLKVLSELQGASLLKSKQVTKLRKAMEAMKELPATEADVLIRD